MPFVLSSFEKSTCILYHFAFLFWLNAHVFSSSIAPNLPLKTRFLTPILPFSTMFFMVLKGFVYAIAVDIYAFCLAFSGILPCVLHHFALHLAPKRTVFSTKTHCILHQNALRFAAYCTPFSCKLHYILLQIAEKLVQMAVLLNKYSFYRIHKLTPFCVKTNLRENRIFAARWALGW